MAEGQAEGRGLAAGNVAGVQLVLFAREFYGILLQINVAAILLAGLLIAYSLLRTKLGESEIYPSHRVLQHSMTALLAGVYLACVGVFANLVARLGGDPSFPVKALLLMVMIVGLTVVVLSDR